MKKPHTMLPLRPGLDRALRERPGHITAANQPPASPPEKPAAKPAAKKQPKS